MRLIIPMVLLLLSAATAWSGEAEERLVREFLACLDKEKPTLADFQRFQGQVFESGETSFELIHCALIGVAPLEYCGDRTCYTAQCEEEMAKRVESATSSRSFFLTWLKRQIPRLDSFSILSITPTPPGVLPYDEVVVRIANTEVVFRHVAGPDAVTFGEFGVLRINGINVAEHVAQAEDTILPWFTQTLSR